MLHYAKDHAFAYPLSPVGGLFFTAAGLGIMTGAFFMQRRNTYLISGAVLAALVMTFLSARIARGLPLPSRWQVCWLIGPIVFEAIVIPFLVSVLRPLGERVQTLGILILVGFHFLPMAPAFGMPIVILGLLAMGNAAVGLWRCSIPLGLTWGTDGALKFCVGLLLLYGSPSFHPL